MTDFDFLNDFDKDSTSNNNISEIAIADITVQEQHRKDFNAESLSALEQSIKSQGLLQPILLRPSEADGKYILVSGERRFRACKNLGMTHILALTKEMNDIEHSINQVAENTARQKLNNYETIIAIKALLDLGLNNSEIARKIGKARSFIVQAVKIISDKNLLNILKEDPKHSVRALADVEKEEVILTGNEEATPSSVEQTDNISEESFEEEHIVIKEVDPRLDRGVTPKWRQAFEKATGIDCDTSASVGDNIKNYKKYVKEKIEALLEV